MNSRFSVSTNFPSEIPTVWNFRSTTKQKPATLNVGAIENEWNKQVSTIIKSWSIALENPSPLVILFTFTAITTDYYYNDWFGFWRPRSPGAFLEEHYRPREPSVGLCWRKRWCRKDDYKLLFGSPIGQDQKEGELGFAKKESSHRKCCALQGRVGNFRNADDCLIDFFLLTLICQPFCLSFTDTQQSRH